MDANGNTTGKTGPTTYQYDYENHLTKITYSDGSKNWFTYDGDGARMSRRDSEGPFTFLYDGADIIQECSHVTGEITSAYRYGVLSLIQQQRSGAESWYLLDGLGSARALLDAGQVVTDTYTYDAFGNLLSSTGSTVNPFRYVGGLGYYQETDSEMLLLGARYYDPMVGRFITPDPLRDGINWYAYVRNQAPNAVDASGYFMGPVKTGVRAAKASGEFVGRQLEKRWVRLAIAGTIVTSTVIALKMLDDPHISPFYYEPEKGGYPHHVYSGTALYLTAELSNWIPLPENMAVFPLFKRCFLGEECCFRYIPELAMIAGDAIAVEDAYQHWRQYITNNRKYESPLHILGSRLTDGYMKVPKMKFPLFAIKF